MTYDYKIVFMSVYAKQMPQLLKIYQQDEVKFIFNKNRVCDLLKCSANSFEFINTEHQIFLF